MSPDAASHNRFEDGAADYLKNSKKPKHRSLLHFNPRDIQVGLRTPTPRRG